MQKQTQEERHQANSQDVVKKYAASLSIFVLAVGLAVCTGSDLAQIPPQVSPEGYPVLLATCNFSLCTSPHECLLKVHYAVGTC